MFNDTRSWELFDVLQSVVINNSKYFMNPSESGNLRTMYLSGGKNVK
jgi:hypothetical protein